MALHAVAHRRGMNGAFYLCDILIGVAGQTEGMGRGRDQLYASDIFRSANLVATRAAHGDRGMNRLAFGLVFVAGNASGGIRLRVKWNRMFRSERTANEDQDQDETCERTESTTGSQTRFE